MNLDEFIKEYLSQFKEAPHRAEAFVRRKDLVLLAEAIRGSILNVVKMLPKEQHGHNFKE